MSTLHLYGAICDLREEPDRRVRRRCPCCKRLCFGTLVTMYDTVRVKFDCGTLMDYGYGYWRKPPKDQGRTVLPAPTAGQRANGGRS